MNLQQIILKREKEIQKELQGISKKKVISVKLDKRLKELELTIRDAQKELSKIYPTKRVKQLNEIIHNSCAEIQEIYSTLNIEPLKYIKLKDPRGSRTKRTVLMS